MIPNALIINCLPLEHATLQRGSGRKRLSIILAVFSEWTQAYVCK